MSIQPPTEMHEYQPLQLLVYYDVLCVHGLVNHYLHSCTCTSKSPSIIVIMVFSDYL